MARKCAGCGRLHLCTVYFCADCGGRSFENRTVAGLGRVATYTIITVPPAGFEEYIPYAWVVLELEGSGLRVSGFMASIASPEELPVGTRARVTGFDDRGLVMGRTDGDP